MMKFTRITSDPHLMGGLSCIRGLRIPVATVVEMVADGMSETEILEAYPDLEGGDIHEALRFAAELLRDHAIPLTRSLSHPAAESETAFDIFGSDLPDEAFEGVFDQPRQQNQRAVDL